MTLHQWLEEEEKLKDEFYKFCPGAKENLLIADFWLKKIRSSHFQLLERIRKEESKIYSDTWCNAQGSDGEVCKAIEEYRAKLLEILEVNKE